MRQKKKTEEKEPDKSDACMKCSKLQNGGHSSFDESTSQSKQTTLGTLKSVLKRSASHKTKDKSNKNQDKIIQKDMQITGKKHKNRVQFDETRNKYFEADYVILIHEEDYDLDDYYDEGSPYDDDEDDPYDDGLMGQKICCSNPNCNNMISLSKYPNYSYSNSSFVDFKYSGSADRDRFDFSSHYYDVNYEEINQNTNKKSSKNTTNRCENEKCQNCHNYFDFELVQSDLDVGQDFSDQVTLSPPEGYKDGGSQCCPHHSLQFHHIVNNAPQKAAGGRRLEFQDGEDEESQEPSQIYQSDLSNDGDNLKLESLGVDTTDGADNDMQMEEKPEKVKQRFIVETITMTTVTERRIVREESGSGEGNQDEVSNKSVEGAKRSGILKGGKFWKNSTEKAQGKSVNYNEVVDYKENENENDSTDAEEVSTSFTDDNEGDNGNPMEDEATEENAERPKDLEGLEREKNTSEEEEKREELDEAASPESTELTLTFKLGQHVLVANSLKPNSAVRQLFPSPRFLSPPPIQDDEEEPSANEKPVPPKQFLVTAESLRLFEEAKRSKILGNMNSSESGQSFIAIMPPISKGEEGEGTNNRIKRTIERNTLRRSLIRYPCDLRSKRLAEKRKNENSLEERIKQLTCGVDDEEPQEETKKEEMPQRSSPQGEESKESNVMDTLHVDVKNLRHAESASPSSNSSSSSSAGSTYKKITDIFSKKNNPQPILEDVNCNIKNEVPNVPYGLVFNQNGPDLGNESLLLMPNEYASNPHIYNKNSFINPKNAISRMSVTSEARKQILSTLAPLAACVTSVEGKERINERYRLINSRDRYPTPNERASMVSSGEETSEYSLDDIDEGLKEESKKSTQPDVIAGTPQNETPNDELALFVQKDAERIEKLKKRYSAADDKSDDDDDYGFNKRPTVKGIKPRFGSTNEIMQQIQNQIPTPPVVNQKPGGHTTWPYYSQENADPKLRTYPPKSEENQYSIYSTPNEYRTYTEVGNANYIEYQGAQRGNYINQSQQSLYSSTNSLYHCQPMRSYPELANYQFRHPPHSPPPVRHVMITPQPSPNPSEDSRLRNVNRNSDSFDNSPGTFENSNRSDLGIPSTENRVVSRPTDGMVRNPESIFYRRTVPNVHNPCLQMKFSPINYHQGAMPTASIRFSASCSPHPAVDESNVIIEPHYSTLPHPQAQSTVGVIRVGQGQQMIRVPVPYPTGTPVQVHLMAGRVGRCDSPQRPGSPQAIPKEPYNQYLIAKGTQTAQIQAFQMPTKSQPDGAPSDTDSVVDFEAQGKAIAEELQSRVKLSRSLSQEANYQHARIQPPRSSSPVNMKTQHERGVPEGAASTTVQDSQPQSTDNAQTSGNTIYYSMNV